jgi:NADH-quinone oxidoreductase subunit L
MYYRRTLRPERFTELVRGDVYDLVLNKYWIDEIYQATIVRGTLALARAMAWFDGRVIDGIVNGAATVVRLVSEWGGLFDKYVVDGAVNGVANGTYFVGRRVRHLQTGEINAYLYVVVVGVLGGVLLYWGLAQAH